MNEQRAGQRSAALVVGIVAILILLTACGAASGVATIDGADDASPTAAASAGPEDPEEALYAFAECMREQGIDMPDPVIRRSQAGNEDGVVTDEAEPGQAPPFDPNSDEFQAAQDECEHLLEGLGALEPGGAQELSPEEEQALLDFAECMREHGIDMPDRAAGGGVQIGPGEEGPSFDPFSDEFQSAREACEHHLEGVAGLGGPQTDVSAP